MRVKVIVVAEDHQNGIKSTKEGYVDVPPHLIESGGDPTQTVRACAQWGLQHAHRAVGAALYGQGGGQPAPGPQGPQAAAQPPPQQPPQQGGGGGRGVPKTPDEIIEQSKGPMRQAIQADRQQPVNPGQGPGPLGFGPHRGR